MITQKRFCDGCGKEIMFGEPRVESQRAGSGTSDRDVRQDWCRSCWGRAINAITQK